MSLGVLPLSESIYLSNIDDIIQRGRRLLVASSLNQINDYVLERDL